MWTDKFVRINKEVVIDRMGKNPYSKELTNLILTRVDMETTFMHHKLPGAIEFLRELFGDVDFGGSYLSALEVIKRYYKKGEKLHQEYMEYLRELGALNMTDAIKKEFLKEKEKLDDFDSDYGWKLMQVYENYQYGLFNIVRLDEKIEEMKRMESEYDEDVGNDVIKRNISSIKILDYFKNIRSNNK
ncbi:MAG: hypothetical protein K2G03_06605 [Bacilli bacterium]|nr:hypothetical protein [Bacilli bacterium]